MYHFIDHNIKEADKQKKKRHIDFYMSFYFT